MSQTSDASPHLLVATRAVLAATLLLSALSASLHADELLGPSTDFGTAGSSISVAIGDLNGDGRPDLVAANTGSYPNYVGSVSVLIGNGDGTFGPKTDFITGINTLSAAIADLNGDGWPDIVTANAGSYWNYSGTFSVLLGNGDGTFRAAVKTYTGTHSHPSSVEIADLNADGRPDLVLAILRRRGIAAYLGNGDGTFGAARESFTGLTEAIEGLPHQIAIGDLDGDGRPDLAVANGYESNTLSVLLGNGNGTFTARTDYVLHGSPSSVAIADLDADGRPDLAVTDHGAAYPDYPGTVSVLLGNGDGRFSAGAEYGAGSGPTSGAFADFDGDGRPDLAFANWRSKEVSVLLGNGDGTLGAETRYDTRYYHPYSLEIADLNADGRPDVAAVSWVGHTVSVLLNRSRPPVRPVAMEFDVTPGTLDPASRGRWVTGFLEPPQPLAAGDIDLPSIRLNGSLPVDASAPTALGDHDEDGVPDLMVKFDRVAVEPTVSEGESVRVTITGTVGGKAFSGADTIRVRRGGLSAPQAGSPLTAGSVTRVDAEDRLPGNLALAIRGPRPNPSMGGRFRIELTLRDASAARLELIDVAGRALITRQVGPLGPGRHALDMTDAPALRPGIYFLRLTQGGREVRARAAVLR
jgi:hypothetical protein